MENFFSNYGLYKVFTLIEDYQIGNQDFTDPYDFVGTTFEYWCEKEQANRTFELDLDEFRKEFSSNLPKSTIPDVNFIDDKLNYIFTGIGKCKSCNNYKVHFTLNVFSDKPISNIKDNIRRISLTPQNTIELPDTNIYIQKVGALPEIRRKPNKLITNFFDRESNDLYYKAANALDKNFGIGAFAYFRRIIEKELIHIVESLKLLPDSHESEIQKLLDQHNENPKISTIYENIFQFLPGSLRVLGDNPIKLLYNLTSEGLHTLSEKDCFEKAEKILKLLDFTIKKINEEKSEIHDLKETIKGLK